MSLPENIIHNSGKLVFHYTSLAVLLKMLEKSASGYIQFHAGGMHCMNDESEFAYGCQQFRKILPHIETKVGEIPELLKLSSAIDRVDKQTWHKRHAKSLLESNNTPFVISTSSKGDDIPMWAMYGDAGHGVAIGLDIANIQLSIKERDGIKCMDWTQQNLGELHAFKVVQQPSLLHPGVMLAIIYYRDYLNKIQQDDKNIGDLQSKALFKMSVLTSSLIKHPAFRFENEWRILTFPNANKEVCYKINSKGILIPYLAVDIPLSLLKKIVIGPCKHGLYQKKMLEHLLYDIGAKDCRVVYSKVPYRN